MSLDTEELLLEFWVAVRATILIIMNDFCLCAMLHMPLICLHSVVWTSAVGVGEPRPELDTPESYLAKRLRTCHVRDCTVLCSPELTAYLGVFPRELTANQVCELRYFMFGAMLNYTDFRLDKGEGPFVTHCGRGGCERIQVMRHSTAKWGQLTNPFHMYAPREGNPPFTLYVVQDSGNEGEIIVEEDVSADDLADDVNVAEDSSDDEDESSIPEEDVAESTYRVPMEVDRELDDDMVEALVGVEPSSVVAVNPQAMQTDRKSVV